MDEASLACRHTLMLVTPTKGIGPHSCVAAIAKTRFMACSPTFLWSEEFDGVSRVVVVCRKAFRRLFPRSGGTRARATRRRRRNVRTYKEKNFLRRVGIKSRYERNASVDTLIHFIPSHRFRRRREGDAARQRRVE